MLAALSPMQPPPVMVLPVAQLLFAHQALTVVQDVKPVATVAHEAVVPLVLRTFPLLPD